MKEQTPIIVSKNEDGSVYLDHESFGVASINRKTLAEPVYLFGMETPVKDVVSMTVKGVTQKDTLDDSFYIENETHIEIMMSANQMTDAFTGMNTQGVPCTITETQSKGRIKLIDPPTVAEYLRDEIVNDIDKSLKASRTLVADVESIMGKSGNINREELETVFKTVQSVSRSLRDSLPHNVESFSKVAEQQLSEAKATVELSLTNKKDKIIQRLATENPDLLKIGHD